VHLEGNIKPHVYKKFEIFWTNNASTMACPNSKNGRKNELRPLGINGEGGQQSFGGLKNHFLELIWIAGVHNLVLS
jgi:hypothetical protein